MPGCCAGSSTHRNFSLIARRKQDEAPGTRSGRGARASATPLAAGTASAAAKPGFLPGTWLGKGTISGSVTDGPMTSHFNARITFTLAVTKKLAVSGRGSWKLGMLGSEDAPSSYAVDATIVGTASLGFKGTSTNVTYAGMQHIEREMRMAGRSTRLAPIDKELTGRLVITRAGKCKVTGSSQIQPGVTLSWSAQLKGSGICNA